MIRGCKQIKPHDDITLDMGAARKGVRSTLWPSVTIRLVRFSKIDFICDSDKLFANSTEGQVTNDNVFFTSMIVEI